MDHIFGLVQHDGSNSDVTLAFRGPEAGRDFPNWSMAFADEESRELPLAQLPSTLFLQTRKAPEKTFSLCSKHLS